MVSNIEYYFKKTIQKLLKLIRLPDKTKYGNFNSADKNRIVMNIRHRFYKTGTFCHFY